MTIATSAIQAKIKPLSDTARVILNTAVQRDSRLIFLLPDSVRAPTHQVQKILRSLITQGLVAECPAKLEDVIWRTNEQEQHLTLRISAKGQETISASAASEGDAISPPEVPITKSAQQKQRSTKSAAAKKTLGTSKACKPAFTSKNSKATAIVALLQRGKGATLPELMKSTGWQAHSVRGFLAGALKKKLGLKVVSERGDGKVRRYRIAGKF